MSSTATATATPPLDQRDRPLAHLATLADEVFERTSPYEGFGFRNHCRRLHRFTTMLMQAKGLSFDIDLAYLVAMVHDLGLVSEQDTGENYLQRSRALFHRETAGLELGGTDPSLVDQCLLFNHRLLPVPNLSPEAECFRRAVIIEHSRGLKRWGLERGPVKQVFEDLPRGNFDRVLLDFTWRTLRREPTTLVNGIFF
jgi:hypothetical protein